MISLHDVVWIVIGLLVAGAVFALLFFLINYVERQFPSEGGNLFAKAARVVLVVLAVLVLIGFLIGLISGQPIFYWRGAPPRMG
jgi:heme/copper-type cytochrome/quinol oxidase subunit 2